jgi:hypothetical protein
MSDEPSWNDEEPPSPELGDTLIKEGRGGDAKTLFADWMAGNWHLYADGYKRAADILVEQLEGKTQDDNLILPIVFMYRHYVELKLKDMIMGYDKIHGIKMPTEKFGTHKLEPLWSYLKAHLSSLPDVPMNAEVIPALDRLIRELVELDPGSFNFRYAHDKARENEMVLPRSLSMTHFKETMDKIKGGLDYLEAGIDVELERRDFEAEMNAEMEMYIDY